MLRGTSWPVQYAAGGLQSPVGRRLIRHSVPSGLGRTDRRALSRSQEDEMQHCPRQGRALVLATVVVLAAGTMPLHSAEPGSGNGAPAARMQNEPTEDAKAPTGPLADKPDVEAEAKPKARRSDCRPRWRRVCRPVLERRCRNVTRQDCRMAPANICRDQLVEQCLPVATQVCRPVGGQTQCRMEVRRECRRVIRRVCDNRLQRTCRPVTQQECRLETRQDCRLERGFACRPPSAKPGKKPSIPERKGGGASGSEQ